MTLTKNQKQAFMKHIDDKIKNPLTVILFLAEELIEQYEKKTPITLEDLQNIVQQVYKIKDELHNLFEKRNY